MTAKSHGLTEECESILDAAGLTEDQITLPALGSPLSPPKPVVASFKSNWPTKAASQSFFEKALLGQVESLSLEDEPAAPSNGFGFEEARAEDGATRNGALIEADDDEDAAGWDMGDDIVPEMESDFVNVDSAEAGAGSSEADLWARNSPLAADHVAGGSFETAMQLLNRQVGAVNLEPLKPRFMEIYQSTKTYLPASTGLPPLVNYVRRTVDETDPRKVLPIIPRDIESLATNDLQKGYDAMKNNKLEDGARIFKAMLHALLVNVVSTASEVDEAKRLITSASEYSVGIAVELARRKLGTAEEVSKDPAKLKRALELSAYFTIPKLEVPHRQLTLQNAMRLAFSNKNFNSALSFANRMIANGWNAKFVENVSRNCFLSVDSKLTFHRHARLKPNANVTPTTPSKSSSTSSPNSTSAQHHIHRSTLAHPSQRVRSMERSSKLSTREPYVPFVESAKWARMEVD
jgi:coatomer protein complex subunit alpha (xenin)